MGSQLWGCGTKLLTSLGKLDQEVLGGAGGQSGAQVRPAVPLTSKSGEGQSALGDRSSRVPFSSAIGESRQLSVPILAPAAGSTPLSSPTRSSTGVS